MVETFSVYPEALDGYASLPLRQNLIHEIRAEDHNRLRDAIIKIEQELGIQPSGTYATVRSRLDEIGDVRAIILAHMADPTDAHDASAISVLDPDDNYFEDDVEGVLQELSSLIPLRPDVLGANNSKVPNTGTVDFFDGYGTKFVFNTSSGDSALLKTQPSVALGCRGVQILDVSTNSDDGAGYILYLGGGVGSERLAWGTPGHTPPAVGAGWPDPTSLDATNSIDVSGLDAGEVLDITSIDDLLSPPSNSALTKKIRIAKTSTPYAVPAKSDTFDVYSLSAVHGVYSLPSAGFKSTKFITRTSISSTDTSRFQFMISGTVFPADRGILVLQKKLRGSTGAAGFFPMAVLDLSANFTESLRATGQLVYTPSLSNFDTILLFDRVPVSEDYSLFPSNASGENRYEDFDNGFSRLQIARYLIPASNTDLVGGELTSPADTTELEADNSVASFRMLHYVDGTTDFTGQPSTSELLSVLDDTQATGDPDLVNSGHHPTRISNVFVDTDGTRPGIEHINLKPVFSDTNDAHTPLTAANVKFLSSIPYYVRERDGATRLTGNPLAHASITEHNKFTVEVRTGNDIFNKTYVRENIITFETDVFDFISGNTAGVWGAQVDVDELLDDGYTLYSAANLPAHGDQAFYFAHDAGDAGPGVPPQDRRLTPAPNVFSNHAWIMATLHDPFGPGDGYDAYGAGTTVRILVNSYDSNRSTDTADWFTDETRRLNDAYEDFTGSTADGYVYNEFDSAVETISSVSLQCGGRFTNDEFNIPGLIYPQNDYSLGTGIAPNRSTINSLSGMPDYTTATGDRRHQRFFNPGYTISRGKIRIKSEGNSLISYEDIRYKGDGLERTRLGKIEVSIPGFGTNSCGWLDIGKLFVTGKYNNGDGAAHGAVTGGPGDFTVPFTFGTRNTGDTNDNMVIRVTYYGQTEDERALSRTKIMTLLQLLPA